MWFTVMYPKTEAEPTDPIARKLWCERRAREEFARLLEPPPEVIKKDDYTSVASVQADSIDDVFRQMNVVDGNELPAKLRIRSLSVGDIVINHNTDSAYYCAPAGWRPVRVQY